MKNKRVLFWVSAVTLHFLALMVFFTVPAWAYIDPSAVTYVIQAVAGVVIAIGACLTIFRHKIVAFFKKNKQDDKKEVHFKDVDESDSEGTQE